MTSVYQLNTVGTTIKLDYDGGTNAIYVGECPPGTATSANFWRIKKLTYDANDNVTDVKWASKEAIAFTVNWDGRAGYTYS